MSLKKQSFMRYVTLGRSIIYNAQRDTGFLFM